MYVNNEYNSFGMRSQRQFGLQGGEDAQDALSL